MNYWCNWRESGVKKGERERKENKLKKNTICFKHTGSCLLAGHQGLIKVSEGLMQGNYLQLRS